MKAVKNIEGLVVAVRGLMLLAVFAAIVFMATGMTQEMVSMHILRNRYVPAAENELTEEQKRDKILRSARRDWLADGTMHLVYSSQPMTYPPKSGRLVEIYDTGVNLLWSGPEEEMPYTYLSGSENYRVMDRRHAMHTEFLIDFSRSFVVPVVSAEKVKVENWRYVPSREYFVGYNARGEKIGYLGAEGFSTDRKKVRSLGTFSSAAAWAPRDSYTPRMLWQSERVLWQIDVEKRQVEKLCESKERIVDIRLFGWRILEEQDSMTKRAIAVYDKEGCHLVIDNPRQVITIELAAEYSQIYHYVRFLRAEDEFYVEVSGMKGAPVDRYDRAAMGKWLAEARYKPIDNWNELHRLEAGGELKLLARNDWIRPADVRGERNRPWERAQEFKKYTTAAAPVVFRPISKWRVEVKADYYNEQRMITRALDDIIIYTAPVSIFYCLLLSLLSVCVAVYHGWSRRRSLAGLIGWLVFVGVFNVAGLLTYLAMNHRPLLRCSTCGKKRHLIGDICIRCGNGLPVPVRRETDLVFAG